MADLARAQRIGYVDDPEPAEQGEIDQGVGHALGELVGAGAAVQVRLLGESR
jgi:hypothetical protein